MGSIFKNKQFIDEQYQADLLREKRRAIRLRAAKTKLNNLSKRKTILKQELESVDKQISLAKEELRVKYKEELSDN